MKYKVRQKGNGVRTLQDALKALGGRRVKVGILGARTNRKDGKLSNVEIGAIHEFGSRDGRIPERSFLRSTVREHKAEYQKMLIPKSGILNYAKRARSHAMFDRQLELLGMRAVSDVKKKIKGGIPPANAPSTIKAKGSSLPLVDTGQLISSITYQVLGKGKK